MKWLALRVGGQKWSVFLAARNSRCLRDDDTGARLNGRCVYEASRIFINRELDEEARAEVLLHELMHALLHVSGADQVYGGSHEKDERIVSALTPLLHRLLVDLGFRFPRGITS